MPETYTGDEGDKALAAGLDVMDGGELWAVYGPNAINKTRDMIAERTSAVTPVDKGGTGATTAAAARENLGVQAAVAAVSEATSIAQDGKLLRGGGGNRISVSDPTSDPHAVNLRSLRERLSTLQQDLRTYDDTQDAAVRSYVNSTFLPIGGGTVTGHLFLPSASPATSSYAVAYLNGDGRVSRGASSARYKTDITDAPDLGDVFAPKLREYQMRDDPDSTRRIGYIAEELVGTPAERFIVWAEVDGQIVPDSIDWFALLMAQVVQLHARVAELEAERDA